VELTVRAMPERAESRISRIFPYTVSPPLESGVEGGAGFFDGRGMGGKGD